FPSVGRLILAGRTGNANENTHFDNIQITTTTSSSPILTGLNGTGFGFTAQITDATGATVDTNSITLKLDNTAVVPQSITKSGLITTISYTGTTIQGSASTHTVALNFKDTGGKTYTSTRDYIAPAYVMVPPAFATASGAVDTTKPGFLVRP